MNYLLILRLLLFIIIVSTLNVVNGFLGICAALEAPNNIRIADRLKKNVLDQYSIYIVKAITNERILPYTNMKGHKEGNQIFIKACPAEYEPASFVISANKDVRRFLPVTTDLIGENGVIRSENVDIKIVKCWYQGCSNSIHFKHCPSGKSKILVPELLLNDNSLVIADQNNRVNKLRVNVNGREYHTDISKIPERVYSARETERADETLPVDAYISDGDQLKPINIAENTNQQFWVTIYVPDATPAGTYKGQIIMTTNGGQERTLNLNITVLPFSLSKIPIEYSIYYRGRLVSSNPERVGSEYKSAEQYQAEMENMVKHGVTTATSTQNYNPSDPETITLFNQSCRLRTNAGMSPVHYVLWSETYFKNPLKAKSLIKHMDTLGFMDVYFYGAEEAKGSIPTEIKAKWSIIQNLGGKVFGSLDSDAAESAADSLDFANVSKTRDSRLAELYDLHNNKIYSYGAPQVGIEEPETYRRSYGLSLWQVNYNGAMLYAYQHAWGSIWNDFDGYFRDHIFAYPTSTGVVDTIQWEGFREGVDDVRYIMTLINFIQQAKVKNISTKSVEDWLLRINTDRDLYELRNQIIDLSLQLHFQITNGS